MKNNRREKIFYIVMIIFFALFPFTLFFNIFEYRKAYEVDGVMHHNVIKYDLVDIKDLSLFPFIVGILFIVLSLIFAVFLAIDLYKGKFYTIYIKILSGLTFIVISGLVFYFSIFLASIFFMVVCCNLFILSFSLKLDKKIKLNLLIYIPTYILFLVMLVLSLGFYPTK